MSVVRGGTLSENVFDDDDDDCKDDCECVTMIFVPSGGMVGKSSDESRDVVDNDEDDEETSEVGDCKIVVSKGVSVRVETCSVVDDDKVVVDGVDVVVG